MALFTSLYKDARSTKHKILVEKDSFEYKERRRKNLGISWTATLVLLWVYSSLSLKYQASSLQHSRLADRIPNNNHVAFFFMMPITKYYRGCSHAPSECRSHLYHPFWLNTGQCSSQVNCPVLGPAGRDLPSSPFLFPPVYLPVELQKQANSVRS